MTENKKDVAVCCPHIQTMRKRNLINVNYVTSTLFILWVFPSIDECMQGANFSDVKYVIILSRVK
jgi:hypothetical protein